MNENTGLMDRALQKFCNTNKSCEKMTSPSLSYAFNVILEGSERKLSKCVFEEKI